MYTIAFQNYRDLCRFLTHLRMKSLRTNILKEAWEYDRWINKWTGRLWLEVRFNGEVWLLLYFPIDKWSKTKIYIEVFTYWQQIWNIKCSTYIPSSTVVEWKVPNDIFKTWIIDIFNNGRISNLGTHAIASIGLYFALFTNDLLVCKLYTSCRQKRIFGPKTEFQAQKTPTS